jgi:tryptophan synthase alpha chain
LIRNQLDGAFASARAQGRGVLIPYLTAGFPERSGFIDLCAALLDAGADALEIGIPFSDPLLDGPSIQGSQQTALDAGVTPEDCLDFARGVRERSGKPVLFMGAYNPIFAYGLDRFAQSSADAGVTAMIVPDLPFEEQDDLRESCTQHGLHLIQLVAPTSTHDRLRRVCSVASGFVYCISVTGVTGTRTEVSEAARPLVERVRELTDVPVAIGFGIAGPDQVRAVTAIADGAIVGSALIDVLREAAPWEREHAGSEFVSLLAAAAHGAHIAGAT